MRIAHIGPSGLSVRSRRGGAVQRRIMELAREQSQAGHDVTVMSPGNPEQQDGPPGVDTLDVVDVPLRSDRPLRDYEFGIRARRALATGFDVLHAHGSPQAVRLLHGCARSTVQSVDFYRYRLSGRAGGRAYFASTLSKYDAVLPVSEFCATGLLAYYGQIRSRVEVVYNGVDLGQFNSGAKDSAALRRAHPELPSEFVLYLGRVCHQKGSDLLGPLARSLVGTGVAVVAAGPSGQFGVLGKSPLVRDLEAEGVVCLGAVDEVVLAPLLAEASMVVLPTREDEMFGMAALEALACGTPVVASRLGGIPEATGPGAVLVPPGDPQELASAVTAVLSSSETRLRLAEAGQAHAEQFAWQEISRRTLEVYETVAQ